MISKSSYVKYINCDKSLWLYLYKQNEASQLTELQKQNITNGNIVGSLARSYFKDTVNVEVRKADGTLDFKKQIENTKEALKNNVNCIAEASFLYNDLFCAVDLLKKDDIGYSIYEVKSSLNLEDYQYYDVSYQKYVLEQSGLKINHIYLLHPNRDYVLNGEFDIKGYFDLVCVDEHKIVLDNLKNIENNLENISSLVKSKEEPKTIYKKECKECLFRQYCMKDLPKNNITELNGITSSYSYLNDGIITIDDYVKSDKYKKSKRNLRKEVQIKSVLENIKDPIIDKDKLKNFLSNIKYPIYHLDFETTNFIIPQFQGFRPGEVYPFQYSLHIEYEDKLEHKEFLGEELDCSYSLAKQLIKDIPANSTIIAYHASTEINVIKYLANKYSDLYDSLMNLTKNFIDLLDAFKNGYYYSFKQNGSNSIKQVMPALCPNMEDNYHNLPVVHNGGEALSMFPKLIELKGTKEYLDVRYGMLKYCELDTLSMVEILKVLKKSV